MPSADIEQVLALLAETPQRLAALAQEYAPAQLQTTPDQDTWSANAILAHLRSCADVWGKIIQAMLAEDNPTLRYISPRTWIRKTKYLNQDFQASFQVFAQQRAELLAALNGLAAEDWARAAIFTGTVSGRNQTVFSYAQRIAEHERPHLDQMKSVLSTVAGPAKE